MLQVRLKTDRDRELILRVTLTTEVNQVSELGRGGLFDRLRSCDCSFSHNLLGDRLWLEGK